MPTRKRQRPTKSTTQDSSGLQISADTLVDRNSNEAVTLTNEQIEFVRKAHQFLENPGILIRLANSLGQPMERLMRFIPEKQKDKIQVATQNALHRGLVWMTSSVKATPGKTFDEAALVSRKTGLKHSVAAFGTGAIGGFAGIASLPIELPITTGIILRSIASIANDFGMDLDDPEIQMECLYVLSLGSPRSDVDDAMESAYWASRVSFATMVREAARFVSTRSSQQIAYELQKKTAPVLIRFLSQVTMRFEGAVSQKVMAEFVPVIGAVGGGVVNAAFADYFSEAARYHFGLRSLEAKHGEKFVRRVYEAHLLEKPAAKKAEEKENPVVH